MTGHSSVSARGARCPRPAGERAPWRSGACGGKLRPARRFSAKLPHSLHRHSCVSGACTRAHARARSAIPRPLRAAMLLALMNVAGAVRQLALPPLRDGWREPRV